MAIGVVGVLATQKKEKPWKAGKPMSFSRASFSFLGVESIQAASEFFEGCPGQLQDGDRIVRAITKVWHPPEAKVSSKKASKKTDFNRPTAKKPYISPKDAQSVSQCNLASWAATLHRMQQRLQSGRRGTRIPEKARRLAGAHETLLPIANYFISSHNLRIA